MAASRAAASAGAVAGALQCNCVLVVVDGGGRLRRRSLRGSIWPGANSKLRKLMLVGGTASSGARAARMAAAFHAAAAAAGIGGEMDRVKLMGASWAGRTEGVREALWLWLGVALGEAPVGASGVPEGEEVPEGEAPGDSVAVGVVLLVPLELGVR